MKVEYVNPFLEAFYDVILQVINVKSVKGKLYIKEGSQSKSGEVIISIGVTGDLNGNVLMNMDEDTAKYIASKMMFGMEVSVFDDMAKSAIAELGNMIAGNSAAFFAKMDKIINITPPTLYTGKNLNIYNYKTQNLCIPMSVDGKIIEIDICIN